MPVEVGPLLAGGDSEASAALAKTAEVFTDSGPTFQKMRAATKKAHEHLGALTGVTERMDLALANLVSTTTAAGALNHELQAVARVLPDVTGRAVALSQALGASAGASARLETELSSLAPHPAAVQAVSRAVVAALNQIAAAVAEAHANAEALKANTEGAGQVLEGAQRLLGTASSLQATLGSLEARLNSLGGAALESEGAISTSMNALNASISSSADRLQEDVQRSTEAASLLTERLVRVAQTIIDSTQRRGSAL
jgi:chromosome segregation ATPase